MTDSFLPEPVVVKQPKFTRVEGSRHSYAINKGTIRGDKWYLVVSRDVRQHLLISTNYITTLAVTADGREFESRRPRHSFQKRYADVDETNEGAKGCIFGPFLCPQRLHVSYAPRCCKSETDVPAGT